MQDSHTMDSCIMVVGETTNCYYLYWGVYGLGTCVWMLSWQRVDLWFLVWTWELTKYYFYVNLWQGLQKRLDCELVVLVKKIEDLPSIWLATSNCLKPWKEQKRQKESNSLSLSLSLWKFFISWPLIAELQSLQPLDSRIYTTRSLVSQLLALNW
jgi:hypothetical protein